MMQTLRVAAATAKMVLNHIAKNPGQSVFEISKATKVAIPDINHIIKNTYRGMNLAKQGNIAVSRRGRRPDWWYLIGKHAKKVPVLPAPTRAKAVPTKINLPVVVTNPTVSEHLQTLSSRVQGLLDQTRRAPRSADRLKDDIDAILGEVARIYQSAEDALIESHREIADLQKELQIATLKNDNYELRIDLSGRTGNKMLAIAAE